jgi:predicted TIM-barrel fold metal-dependent hydrolase
VGNLPAGTAEFRTELDRLARNPLFRGVRLRDVSSSRLVDPAVRRDLRLLAEKNLSLDINGGPDLLPAIARLSAELPSLRILINHVANVRIDGERPPAAWLEGMQAAAAQPNVYCKVSGLVEGSGRRNSAPAAVDFYRPVLDHVLKCFGEDRLVYGSNWPVSGLFADLATVHSIVKTYFSERGEKALRKVFAQNCYAFYRPPGR